ERRSSQTRRPVQNRRGGAQSEAAAQARLRLHREDTVSSAGVSRVQPITRPVPGAVARSKREKTLWKWVNVSNLDMFLKDVYDYYQGCGIWCILLDRFLNLA